MGVTDAAAGLGGEQGYSPQHRDDPSAFLHSDVRENFALWNEWSVQMDQAERFFAAQGQKNP